MRRTTNDGVATYMREIATFSKIDEATETALALQSKAGDTAARDALIQAHLPVVAYQAKRRYHKTPNLGVCLANLIAEGNLALIRAVDSFTPGQGYRLATHVRKCLRESFRELTLHAADRRLPYSHESLTQVIAFKRTRQALSERTGRTPTFDEVADVLGLSENRHRQMRFKLAAQQVGGFETPKDGSESSGATMDPADHRTPDPRDEAEVRDLIAHLRAALDRLDPEDAESLRLCYGIGCEPLNQLETARRLGVCPRTLVNIQTYARRRVADLVA